MICDFEVFVCEHGKRHLRCKRCGHITRPTSQLPEKYFRHCAAAGPQPPEPDSVGNRLQEILASDFEVTKTAGCGCPALRSEMNGLGVDGCRQHRHRLIVSLRQSLKNIGVVNLLSLGCAMLAPPSYFKFTDPLGSVLDEAILRQETKEATP